MASTLNLSLTDELRAFIDPSCGEARSTPRLASSCVIYSVSGSIMVHPTQA